MLATPDEIALAISGAALAFSLASFYLTSLKPFRLEMYHTPVSLHLYKITPEISGDEEGRTWWIPSFDVGFSLHNSGSRSGVVYDLRVVVELMKGGKKEEYFFYPHWVVEYGTFQKSMDHRLEWLETAVQHLWHPIPLGGSEAVHVHVVLEMIAGRWDTKRIGDLSLAIEYRSSESPEWMQCCRDSMPVWEEMYETQSSYGIQDSHLSRESPKRAK